MISERIDGVIRVFLFKIKTPIDPRDDETGQIITELVEQLFDVTCEEAGDEVRIKGFRPGIEALRCYVIYASQIWAEAAEYINDKKLPLIAKTSGGDTLALDTRGFIGALLQLPREERGELNPILDEIMEEERRQHPEYITFERANRQPEIRLTKAQFEDIVPIDQLLDRQLLAAYFDTYDMLQVYRGFHDYDDPMAKELAVRMELILKRMEETASGKV